MKATHRTHGQPLPDHHASKPITILTKEATPAAKKNRSIMFIFGRNISRKYLEMGEGKCM